jgi:hypothetical protein
MTALTPTGGLIVGGIGIGMVLSGLLGGAALNYGFGIGAAIGFGGAALARPALRARFGEPSKAQARALRWAIATELTAFAAVAILGHNWTFDQLLVSVLIVVSAHFLIMMRSHGPMMVGLGLAGLAWLALAELGLNATIGQVLIGDGLIKLFFGGLMIRPIFLPSVITDGSLND